MMGDSVGGRHATSEADDWCNAIRIYPILGIYPMATCNATACFARMEDIRVQFGKLLRGRRRERGLTQEELAFRAGMDVTYLSDLERGKWNPSLAMIVDLARGLSVHPSELLIGLQVDQADATGTEDPILPERKRGGH
ncbi:helix-turn-helix domain-containing protein [Nitrospirillum viridazoti]|nr:helix-turn-helix transcriptional regulator [Nitrospirillum amazonense]